MATVDDLIQTLHGGVHVSQEGYDLQALQEYLSQHIHQPPLANSPSTSYRPMPSSRSASSSRFANIQSKGEYSHAYSTEPHGYQYQSDHQHYPHTHALPPSHSLSHHSHSHSHSHSHVHHMNTVSRSQSRPATLRRSSSYGCALPPSSPYGEYAPFEGDAFAPLVQQDIYASTSADPWARIRVANEQASSGQGFGSGSGSGFGFGFGFGSSGRDQGNAFGGNVNNAFGGGYGTQPAASASAPSLARDGGISEMGEDNGMMVSTTTTAGRAIDCDVGMDEEDEEDEQSVEREMGLDYSAPLPPPASAFGWQNGGQFGVNAGNGNADWQRGRW